MIERQLVTVSGTKHMHHKPNDLYAINVYCISCNVEAINKQL